MYSPNGPFDTKSSYLYTYPGDDYVDVLGFDYYDTDTTADGSYFTNLKSTVKLVQGLAKTKNKLSALTEAGLMSGGSVLAVSGNVDKDWFNEVVNALSSTNMAYFLTWANFDEKNFFEPYMVSATKGHEMINNFIDFYNNENSVFADGVGDYSSISAKNTNLGTTTTGYIESPVSGDRMLAETKITASVKNEQSGANVSFTIKNNSKTTVATLTGKKSGTTYTANITAAILKKLGKTYGSIEMNIDGTLYDTINILFNIPISVDNPALVDDFESYGGSDDLLNLKWTSNFGSGCSITPTLTSDASQHNSGSYGLAFNYNIIKDGWAGITINKAEDWSAYNALQFWCKPDGKGQRLVIQITSNGEDFEVSMPEFAATTKAQLITLPFSKFVGKNNGTFDPTKITKMGLWCNTIGDATINSSMYFDSIKVVKTT